jgi:hypothetical protein
MPAMHKLRSSSWLARLILAWFVSTLGVAMASPLIHPQAMELVCTTGSMVKLVVVGEDGVVTESGSHTLDCAMCLNVAAPPPLGFSPATYSQPLAHALLPVVVARMAALVGAPLPARGPPSPLATPALSV